MGGEILHFRDLIVWRKAIDLGRLVYEATKLFPRQERFGLTSQVRRAALSVSSNIAEGHARQGREYAHFLSIALGSLAETESQLLFAVEIGYLDGAALDGILAVASEIRRIIAAILRKLPT